MKRLTLYAATCAVLLAGCSQPSYSQVSAGGEEFSAIALPALPEKLDFAGEEVPLEYFDVREALQRELLQISVHGRECSESGNGFTGRGGGAVAVHAQDG